MESRGYRLEFGLLVLLASAIAAWFGEDRTPSREVVELVSVVYRPARMVPSEPAAPNADHIASPKQLIQERAPLVVQRAKTGPRRGTASVAKAACRPPACPARARAANAATKHVGARQGRKPEPPLPAAFVPIRKLGLYLQARLGASRHGKAAPSRERKR